MRTAVASKPAADFTKPDTVVSVSIDPATGFLATPDCPTKLDEFYVAGAEPADYCPEHGAASDKPSPLQPLNTDVQPPEMDALPLKNTNEIRHDQ